MTGSGWVSWLVSGFGLVALVASCGDAKNDARSTAVGGGAGAAAAGGGQHVSSNTSAGAGESPERRDGLPWLGASCRVSEDCGDPRLRCLSEDEDGHGAPGGGLCTADCETDDDCRGFDAGAVCATLAEAPLVLAYATKTVPRRCLQGCSLGSPGGSSKCHGRVDMACRPFAPHAPATCFGKKDVCPDGTACFRGVCRELACGPRCNADADCDGNLHCNPFTGLCDAEAALPVPVGAECPGDTAPSSNCGGGNCLQVDGPDGVAIKRMCTQSCTLGSLCGEGTGACASPRFADFAVGDAGYCLQRCDCDSQCVNPADHCVPWGDPDTERAYGSRGACDYAPEGSVTLTCEDDRGQAGAGGANSASGAGGAAGGG